jgi:hypothetical protein
MDPDIYELTFRINNKTGAVDVSESGGYMPALLIYTLERFKLEKLALEKRREMAETIQAAPAGLLNGLGKR